MGTGYSHRPRWPLEIRPCEIAQITLLFMYYTYILQSKKDKKLYAGSTQNLRLRFEQRKLNLEVQL